MIFPLCCETGRVFNELFINYIVLTIKILIMARTKKEIKRWTREEDERLFRQIKAFPQNMHKCFLLVSEEIGRTPGACGYRWYNHLSKMPEYKALITISSNHISVNRKNGMGERSSENIWRRVLRVLRLI